MLTYSIIVFAITAVGGLFLAVKILTGHQAPWAISIVHALLGATGLVLLILTVLNETAGFGRITAALGLLIIAALGGFYLASIHFKGKLAPKSVVMVHGGVATAGFLTLLSVALGI